MVWIKRFLFLIMFFGLLGVSSLVGFYFYIEDELPSEAEIRDVRFQIPMKIYTQDGELISQFGEKRRTPLLFKEFPQQLIDAILATEDSRFYEHYGIDPVGVMRAAFDTIILGKRAQGASTITMQLARNAFLTLDRTLLRKIKEVYITFHIERLLSKEEILTLYLNKIYFGNRAYGAGAAAQVYYGKDLKDLNLAQLAMIAGLPKAPSNYNPLRSPQKAMWRRNVVLLRMLDEGLIDRQAYQQARSEPVSAKFHGAQITADAPYVAEEVRKFMVDKFGRETAYTEGFNVYTTIHSKAQRAAEQAVVNNIHEYDERHGYRGPVQYLWQEGAAQSTENDEPSELPDAVSTVEALGSKAWTLEAIEAYLDGVEDYASLTPAIVTNVTDKAVYVALRSGKFDVIEWPQLSWARSFISDNEQGADPTSATDIVRPGALIWVRKAANGALRLSQLPEVSGALVALEPATGNILALVGGYDFHHNQYNRITQAKRQIGSNIKPFIYSAAIDKGYTLASLINDAPINKWDRALGTAWRPKNSPETYSGPTRVRLGLAQSKNVMAVRLMRAVGLSDTVEHLAKFGFDRKDIQPNESLSLGSASFTPLEVARGMSAFANGGKLVHPTLIAYVTNTAGKVVLDNRVTQSTDEPEQSQTPTMTQIISPQNAFLISDAMNSTVYGGGNWGKGTGWNGTAWRAQNAFPKRRDLSGKTGTTNDSKDTWYTGFTSQILATTWVGFDDPGRELGSTRYNTNLPEDQTYGAESGAKTALPAWIGFMAQIIDDYPPLYREIPEGITSVRIDIETGLLSRKTDHTTRFEYFIKGTEPTTYAENSEPQSLDDEGKVEDVQEIF